MEYITLVEYAHRNGVHPDNARQKANRGGYMTAKKIGRDWFIDPDEPNLDGRIKKEKDRD